MTKIAIVPNAAGTGTFTIEAPNSNSNRTLTLPDAAGEIVAETAGNEVYKKQNILGTVSQSAGVPTGAIIERGSNANGEFVKYADGTMICTRNYADNPNVTFTLANGIWTFYPFTFSFPVSFVGEPSCSVGRIFLSTGFGWATPRDVSTSAVSFTLFDERDRSNTTVTLRYTVVGRWF